MAATQMDGLRTQQRGTAVGLQRASLPTFRREPRLLPLLLQHQHLRHKQASPSSSSTTTTTTAAASATVHEEHQKRNVGHRHAASRIQWTGQVKDPDPSQQLEEALIEGARALVPGSLDRPCNLKEREKEKLRIARSNNSRQNQNHHHHQHSSHSQLLATARDKSLRPAQQYQTRLQLQLWQDRLLLELQETSTDHSLINFDHDHREQLIFLTESAPAAKTHHPQSHSDLYILDLNAVQSQHLEITSGFPSRSVSCAMSPSVLVDQRQGKGNNNITSKNIKTTQQSNLAKLAMNQSVAPPRSTPPTSSPALTSSPANSDFDQSHLSLLPPPARSDGGKLTPAMAVAQSSMKAMHDLTDTPQPLSLNSTAPSSPRLPPIRQNSGTQTPRVRPHATTLNIPGMTRSKVSPDGRIPQRDVAAKLVIVMVGLPARGKSYITKKLQRYLSWQQHESQIFNVGNRRRKKSGKTVQAHPKLSPEPARLDPPVPPAASNILRAFLSAKSYFEPSALDLNNALKKAHEEQNPDEQEEDEDQSAQFFDPNNEHAAKVREQVAMDTLDELLDYLLEGGGSVGILDATNSTIERRAHIVDHIKSRDSKLGILFIESICRDERLLEANMRLKLYGPDYRDKDPKQSLADFKKRVAAYESAYVPLGQWEEDNNLQYIQLIDVGRKLIQHRVQGFLSNGISTYLGSFNLSPRQIWITRHGQSMDNESGKLGGNSPLTERGHCYATALHKFITHKRQEWLINEMSKEAQASFPPLPGENTPPYPDNSSELEQKNFCVWTSMLQRSVETAEYFEVDDDYDVKNWEMLNELNAGQFEGMTYAEIAKNHPQEFNKRSRDKLNYIYPGVGGEGYLQVISRLRDMVREIERINDHLLIIGHRSVCRVLMAYFMDLTREDITDMDVPLGALYAIEPKPYGLVFHAYKYNEQQGWFDEVPNHTPTRAAHGI